MHISPVLWQFLVKWLNASALFPREASTIAPYADALYFFLLLITAGWSGAGGFPRSSVSRSAIRKEKHPEAIQVEGSTLLEATWTIIPLALFLIVFVWGALLYFRIYNPPTNAMNIYVVGKAVDVEGRASGRAARDQCAACADRPSCAVDNDLAGRVSQLFHSGFSREA